MAVYGRNMLPQSNLTVYITVLIYCCVLTVYNTLCKEDDSSQSHRMDWWCPGRRLGLVGHALSCVTRTSESRRSTDKPYKNKISPTSESIWLQNTTHLIYQDICIELFTGYPITQRFTAYDFHWVLYQEAIGFDSILKHPKNLISSISSSSSLSSSPLD